MLYQNVHHNNNVLKVLVDEHTVVKEEMKEGIKEEGSGEGRGLHNSGRRVTEDSQGTGNSSHPTSGLMQDLLAIPVSSGQQVRPLLHLATLHLFRV